jgi:hypothetical protein
MATDPKDIFSQNLRTRFYKALDYLTLFVYVVVVSVGALVADYFIVYAIQLTVLPAVLKYPIVSQAFDWFQIGSAFLALIAAGIHAFFSVYSQVKFEVQTAKEPILGDAFNE